MERPKPDISPGPQVSNKREMEPSEYGGRGGLTQRSTDGHYLTASEQALLIRREGLAEAPFDPDAPWARGSHDA
ncbi:hypothetical protein FF36_00025 [Frankia torreyi]|uniref:Uncharacterized protein n=1 Tax=Frankia torreyi TaxID=1856 RepID=A0A0D8BPV2_9ACTN|nr:hypothetical protein FF36_00025 [Frankia torreyi]